MIPQVITQNNTYSYNKVVNEINKRQKENVIRLESALIEANKKNASLQSSIDTLNSSLRALKNQVFINQVLIDNYDRSSPYYYNRDLLV